MGADRAPGSSRALRLDPFALPVRYTARDGGRADGQVREIELDRDRVMLRRAVSGIRMNVGVPVSAFRGVTLRLLPAEGDEPAAIAIVLEHTDPGLSVPVFVASEAEDASAIWRSWSRVLGLPLLIDEGDGTLREPFQRLGRMTITAPKPRRRRRAAIKWRRPSILMRRKPGRPASELTIYRGEHEIIARN
jgi:hypothetical protein